ncbi:MAG: hypothetical protein AAGA56_30850, partial [Myxococcota bacterium]
QPLESSSGWMLGDHTKANDIDYYRLSVGASIVGIVFQPGGAGEVGRSGDGSDNDSTFTVLSADGQSILAQLRQSDMTSACAATFFCDIQFRSPPDEAEVLLRVEGPAAPSARSYYTVQSGALQTVFLEPEGDALDANNDGPSNALEPNRNSFAGTLDDENDVDWWIVGEQGLGDLTGRCRAAVLGSGLVDVEVQAFRLSSNGVGEPEARLVERPDRWIEFGPNRFSSVAPSLPGGEPYLVRIQAGGVRVDVSSRHYQCTFVGTGGR